MSKRMLAENLKELTDEVDELHPLLDSIFQKMPSIQNVAYTHGVNEMGADFVLTKLSEELGDTEYVGVIAKASKILQNTDEIERQIDECAVSRITTNGRKEIHITEIWVVSNNTISQNAVRKIHNKYKLTKVHFIDNDRLSSLVEKYVPEFTASISIKESKFLEFERKAAADRDMAHSILPALERSLYVEQDVVRLDVDDYNKLIVRRSKKTENVFSAIESKKVITLEAQMGAGKSKLLNRVVEHYSTPEIYADTKIIPIYVRAQDLFNSMDKEGTLSAIAAQRCGDFSSDAKKIFLFLIDGLDEANIKTADERAFLARLIDEVNSDARYRAILTSRPFSDDDIEYLISRKTERYELRPLTLNKIIHFIDDLCTKLNAKTRLIEDLKKSSLFKVLPRTPIAAILLARLLNEHQEELPANLTELYTKYIELSLGRWDHSRGLATHKEFEAKLAILSEMAKFMLDNEVFFISRADAMGFFKEYLKERNLKLDGSVLFNSLLERSDILAEDIQNGSISFKHKSFADYFYARHLFSSNHIKLDSKIFHPYWVNVYFFFLGLKGDCPDLVSEILAIPTVKEGVRFSRFVNMGNFLLAAHKTPYKYITDALLNVFLDAGVYFTDILNGKAESSLSKLPPMYLLAILRSLMSDSYSYQFFKEAIVASVEEIFTRSKIDDKAAYALFFLELARAEVGGERVFDKLAEAVDDELPLPIQLAIGHETDGKNTSLPIKKLEKKLRKNRRSSAAFDQAVLRLYNESIDGKKLPTQGSVRKKKKRLS